MLGNSAQLCVTFTSSRAQPCIAEESSRAQPYTHGYDLVSALKLDLRDNKVGDNGVWALAGLKEAPALHTLHLIPVNNDVGDNLYPGVCCQRM